MNVMFDAICILAQPSYEEREAKENNKAISLAKGGSSDNKKDALSSRPGRIC